MIRMKGSAHVMIQKGFNSFQLKILAVAFMTLDHIHYFLSGVMSVPFVLTILGRIAAPIFFYLMASSMAHTRSQGKYLTRLYIASVLMACLNYFININLPSDSGVMMIGNIFQTMTLSCLLIYAFEAIKKGVLEKESRTYVKGLLILFLMVLTTGAFLFNINLIFSTQSQWSMILHQFMVIFVPNVLICEGSIFIVLMGFGFYFCLHNKEKLIVFFTIISGIFLFSALAGEFSLEGIFMINYQWLQILALPFLLAYNDLKGIGLKYFFYVYYPLHMVLLLGINQFLIK